MMDQGAGEGHLHLLTVRKALAASIQQVVAQEVSPGALDGGLQLAAPQTVHAAVELQVLTGGEAIVETDGVGEDAHALKGPELIFGHVDAVDGDAS